MNVIMQFILFKKLIGLYFSIGNEESPSCTPEMGSGDSFSDFRSGRTQSKREAGGSNFRFL